MGDTQQEVLEASTGVRKATQADVDYLAPRLREADRMEIKAASNHTPESALTQGLSLSQPCLTGVYRNEPILMFGAVPVPNNEAVVWMLGTPRIENAKFALMRETQKQIHRLMGNRRRLWNLVDARNHVHVLWIKRSGFRFVRVHHGVGPEKRPFIEFERTI